MSIHKRIKEKRTAKKLSMKALAKLVGVDAWQTVQQWENKDETKATAPQRTRLELVAKVLDTSPEYLLYGRDPSQEQNVLQFAKLSGLEAQLVMQYRALSEVDRAKVSSYAYQLGNKGSSEDGFDKNTPPGLDHKDDSDGQGGDFGSKER